MLKIALKECKHVFENLGCLVDVGGGNGAATKLIQETNAKKLFPTKEKMEGDYYRYIVIDEANDDPKLTELKLEFDSVMLAMLNGKEREKKEWEKLIYDAGSNN
ncbi:hypothetical protein RIF29_39896 [Crotalaria pallida]|uniref:O-methyltransferase domain-containing protein n=1 Tax=Crotalaria pallida TaxID=3830 RepID=A0AAN9E7I6_CROPI